MRTQDAMLAITDAIELTNQRLMREILKYGLGYSLMMSSGGLSSEDLAEMDHPYATRHGSPKEPPEIINKQTGVFFDSWGIRVFSRSAQIYNDAPYAEELRDGKMWVFARPILDVVESAMEDELAFLEAEANEELSMMFA
jgi:hypothetical protein